MAGTFDTSCALIQSIAELQSKCHKGILSRKLLADWASTMGAVRISIENALTRPISAKSALIAVTTYNEYPNGRVYDGPAMPLT